MQKRFELLAIGSFNATKCTLGAVPHFNSKDNVSALYTPFDYLARYECLPAYLWLYYTSRLLAAKLLLDHTYSEEARHASQYVTNNHMNTLKVEPLRSSGSAYYCSAHK